jgi:hypothetical protein
MKFLKILGFLWSFPISFVFWIFMGILFLLKQVEKVSIEKDFLFVWDLYNNKWFCRVFFKNRGWGGFSFGNNIVLIDFDKNRKDRTFLHEKKHCEQYFTFGILFFVLYALEFLVIYFFNKDLHPYYDHWFEVEARTAAGQMVKIPKSLWEKDRWCWW